MVHPAYTPVGTARARRSMMFNNVHPGTIVRRRGDGKLAEVLSTAAWPSTWITVRLRDTGAVVKLRGASAFTIPTEASARKRNQSAIRPQMLPKQNHVKRPRPDQAQGHAPGTAAPSPAHSGSPLTPKPRGRPRTIPRQEHQPQARPAPPTIISGSAQSFLNLVVAASILASPRHSIFRQSVSGSGDNEAAVANSLLFLGDSV